MKQIERINLMCQHKIICYEKIKIFRHDGSHPAIDSSWFYFMWSVQ